MQAARAPLARNAPASASRSGFSVVLPPAASLSGVSIPPAWDRVAAEGGGGGGRAGGAERGQQDLRPCSGGGEPLVGPGTQRLEHLGPAHPGQAAAGPG